MLEYRLILGPFHGIEVDSDMVEYVKKNWREGLRIQCCF